MLSLFKNIAAIPIPLGEADQYHVRFSYTISL